MKELIKEIRNIKPDTKMLREMGLGWGALFIILGGLLWFFKKHAFLPWGYAGLIFIALGILSPRILKPVYIAALTFGLIMGRIVGPIILSLLFFLVVTPIGIILRMKKKDFMPKHFDVAASSYWRLRSSDSNAPQRCENQY